MYVYYGTNNYEKLNLIFSNKEKIRDHNTFIEKNLSDPLIDKIAKFIKSDII